MTYIATHLIRLAACLFAGAFCAFALVTKHTSSIGRTNQTMYYFQVDANGERSQYLIMRNSSAFSDDFRVMSANCGWSDDLGKDVEVVRDASTPVHRMILSIGSQCDWSRREVSIFIWRDAGFPLRWMTTQENLLAAESDRAYAIVWRKFLINVGLFSSMILVLAICATSLGRSLRAFLFKRKSRCVRCGYNVVGIRVCPECGTHVDLAG
jgi:hypothetical protein